MTPPLELTKLNHRHAQIVNWLILHPDKTQGDCARAFGYTEPWLSRLINSDLFQVALQQRQAELGRVCVHTMANKLQHLAALTIDRSIELVQTKACTERFLSETRDSVLDRLGYGVSRAAQPQGSGEQKHLHIHVEGDTLQRAREKARALTQGLEGEGAAA